MVVCIAGKNDVSVRCLEYALGSLGGHQIVALPCRSDTANDTWQRSLALFAKEHRTPIISVQELYPVRDLCLVSIEYDRLLNVKEFSSRKLFNIHFSLLPAYRGAYTAIWPILNGEQTTGVTLHEIDEGIDTGPIVDSIAIPIALHDRSRDVYNNCLKAGFAVFQKNIQSLVSGSYVSTSQPFAGASFFSRKSIDFSRLQINLWKTAFEVHNQIRAFCFPEYQLPVVFDHRIFKSQILPSRSTMKPGTVIANDPATCVIATIDYDVRLYKEPAHI